MDMFDQASRIEELHRDESLAVARAAKRLKPTGFCLYCGEEVRSGVLFCPPPDGETGCAADYEQEQRAKRIAGR